MRGMAVVLTFATATLGVGCGGEEPCPAPVERAPVERAPVEGAATELTAPAGGTDVVGESPVARALAPWKTDQPQHFRLAITHIVQAQDHFFVGDPGNWRVGSPERKPLEVEAWVDPHERAVRSYGASETLTHYATRTQRSSQIGVPPDARPLIPKWERGKPGAAPIPVMNPGPAELGWAPDRPPAQLGDDLVRLLDLAAVAQWLGSVTAWSTSMAGAGTSHHGMARWPEGALTGWTREVDVTVVVSADQRLELLEIAVRRGRKPEPAPVYVTGWPDDPVPIPPPAWAPLAPPADSPWAEAFPFPPLKLPNDVYGPSKPRGDPTIGFLAHERTVFVLIPDPNPVSPELASFIKSQGGGR